MQLTEDIPLAPFTTFRIGGRARFFARVENTEDIQEAIRFASKHVLSLFVLGGGSNVLISDRGWSGLVIKIALSGREVEEQNDTILLTVASGERWDALVAYSAERGWWGIENLSGIPGSVGGAAVQNIGAYGVEIKDSVLWVDVFDTEEGAVKRFNNAECHFGYRTSLFKKDSTARFIIVRVALQLSKRGYPNRSYHDVQQALSAQEHPTAASMRDVILDIRSRKFPDLALEGTAGSFFLNPVVSFEKAAQLASQFPAMPQFPSDIGVKISLAYLLDKGLRMKGTAVGKARLFENQPLVLVAHPGASAADVKSLAALVREKIYTTYGIDIQEEVRIIDLQTLAPV